MELYTTLGNVSYTTNIVLTSYEVSTLVLTANAQLEFEKDLVISSLAGLSLILDVTAPLQFKLTDTFSFVSLLGPISESVLIDNHVRSSLDPTVATDVGSLLMHFSVTDALNVQIQQGYTYADMISGVDAKRIDLNLEVNTAFTDILSAADAYRTAQSTFGEWIIDATDVNTIDVITGLYVIENPFVRLFLNYMLYAVNEYSNVALPGNTLSELPGYDNITNELPFLDLVTKLKTEGHSTGLKMSLEVTGLTIYGKLVQPVVSWLTFHF